MTGANGLSLRNAMTAKDESTSDALIAAAPCRVCKQTASGETVDWGPLKKHRRLLFHEVVKTCSCGFQNRLFIVVNDLERRKSSAIKTAAAAMEDALGHEGLEPAELDESVADIMALVFAKQSEQALKRAEQAVAALPEHPRAWYNLAWLYGEMGRIQEGIVAYQVSLSFDPDAVEALYNQAFLMAESGDAGRAVLNLARIIQIAEAQGQTDLAEDIQKLVGETLKVRARANAEVGTVEVVEDQIGRRILINQQNQGGALFEPSAAAFLANQPNAATWVARESERCALALEPGPVPDSFFNAAWLPIGLQHPQGQGLALGLGSGSGLVALLSECPEMTLVVVEKDATVVAEARQWFPLMRWFESEGRLQVTAGEAGAWLDGRPLDGFDFLIADVFHGENEAPDILTAPRLAKLREAGLDIWLNLIISPKNDRLRTTLARFAAAGCPFQYAALSCPPGLAQRISANWIFATRAPDVKVVRAHQPFAWCSPEQLHLFHSTYRLMGEWHLDETEIKSLLD